MDKKVQYASVGLRLFSYFLNSLPIFAFFAVGFVAMLVLIGLLLNTQYRQIAILGFVIFFLSPVFAGIYYIRSLAKTGTSFGNQVTSTKVQKNDGSRIGVRHAVVRYFVVLVSWVGLFYLAWLLLQGYDISVYQTHDKFGNLIFALLSGLVLHIIILYAFVLVTPRKQALHDLLSGTIVVKI